MSRSRSTARSLVAFSVRAALAAGAFACARTPLPSNAAGASNGAGDAFGPGAGFGRDDAGDGPTDDPADASRPPGADAGEPEPSEPDEPCCDAVAGCAPEAVADCVQACLGQPSWDLFFSLDPELRAAGAGVVKGTLSRVDPTGFELKTLDGPRAFGFTRPGGAAIPFRAGEDAALEYRLDAEPSRTGDTGWAVTLYGLEGPRYAARSGRAERVDTLLGVRLRGAAPGCATEYIGDCIQARNAVVVLNGARGKTLTLGNAQRARIPSPEAGPVTVDVRVALDDQDACSPPERHGIFVALEMRR